MNDLLPWQQDAWSSLMTRKHANNLPHALLMTGLPGLGKQQFVNQLARGLLCKQPDMQDMACGNCQACQLINAGSHPDLIRLSPEKDSKVIKIDQVRKVSTTLSLTSQYGGYRVAIIYPADCMNAAAANSLLKTLEEPPANTILILVTSQPMYLPATVRSRCQNIAFPVPPQTMALDWVVRQGSKSPDEARLLLALANGAPLRALEMAEEGDYQARQGLFDDLKELASGSADPVQVAANWLKDGAKFPLYCMNSWLTDMIRLKMAQEPPYLSNPDLADNLRKLADRLNLGKLFEYLGLARSALGLVNTQANDQMLLESILIPWQGSCKK